MPGVVIKGQEYGIDGLKVLNWKDDPRLKRGHEDGRNRFTSWVRCIIVHTTKGIPGGKNRTPQTILPGGVDNKKEFDVSRFWSTDPTQSGAHLIIDTDGSVACIADLKDTCMYHAGNRKVNDISIGIEIYQNGDGSIYQSSLDAAVILIDFLCRKFAIQRQTHYPYKRAPIRRLRDGGIDCVGVFGHRDVSSNRGLGDPGDFIFEALAKVGFERYDFSKNEDKDVWKERQASLGIRADGIPGKVTVRKSKEAGKEDGLWAPARGIDQLIDDFQASTVDFEGDIVAETIFFDENPC